jgi:hypothetical protein
MGIQASGLPSGSPTWRHYALASLCTAGYRLFPYRRWDLTPHPGPLVASLGRGDQPYVLVGVAVAVEPAVFVFGIGDRVPVENDGDPIGWNSSSRRLLVRPGPHRQTGRFPINRATWNKVYGIRFHGAVEARRRAVDET